MPLVGWLRTNPLGPALTVTFSGLLALFILPQLTLWLTYSPRVLLAQVLLSAAFVPYATYRVHATPWKWLAWMWVGIYLIGLVRTPVSLRVMHPLAIAGHMTSWFLIGFVLTVLMAFWKRPSSKQNLSTTSPPQSPTERAAG